MKTTSVRFRIITPDRGKTWQIVEKATGAVVWTGKTFRGARTAHVQHERGYDFSTARRMGNA